MEMITDEFVPVKLIGMNHGGMVVKAAVPTGGMVNGLPEFIVAAEDSDRQAAVSWRVSFQPYPSCITHSHCPDDCLNPQLTKYSTEFFWGHYKHGMLEVEGIPMTPFERANLDMIKRLIGHGDMLTFLPTEV